MNDDGILVLSWLFGLLLMTLISQWFVCERKKHLVQLARTHKIDIALFRARRSKYERFNLVVTTVGVGCFFMTSVAAIAGYPFWWGILPTVIVTIAVDVSMRQLTR
jgi:hypothetical protein